MHAEAHQRQIRDTHAELDPRPIAATLNGYSVETITRADAVPLISRYEWLGTVGRAIHFVGLLSPGREIQGAACFGYGPAGQIRELIGAPALCLERGACVHYAPRNAASYLINSACKLIYRITGTTLYFAYGDPMAGEYGGVYQAAGWIYLGQGLDGGKGRSHRYMVLPPGANPDRPENWRTTRDLRRAGNRMTFADARAAEWQISKRPAKYVYAINVGPQRKKWRRVMIDRPYPAPQPELKRRNASSAPPPAEPIFLVPRPPPRQFELFSE